MTDIIEDNNKSYKISNSILKKIDLLLLELKRRGVDAVKSDFFHLLRGFFKEFFKVNYEFTSSELQKDVLNEKKLSEKQKKDLIFLVEDFEDKEYSPEDFSEEELRGMIKQFRSIIIGLMDISYNQEIASIQGFEYLVYSIRKELNSLKLKAKKGAEKKFFSLYFKAREHLLKKEIGLAREVSRKLLKLYAQLPASSKKRTFHYIGRLNKHIAEYELNDVIRDIDERIDKLHRLIEKDDIEPAKKEYKKMNSLYNTLPKKNKAKMYKDIDICYKLIKKKESELLHNEIRALIDKAKRELKNKEDELVEKYYMEIEDKFRKLGRKEQKKLKKAVDELYFSIYSEKRDQAG